MNTAGWDVKGSNDWTFFEEHLLGLHALWNDLWSSVIETVRNHTYILAFTPLSGRTLPEDHMIHVCTVTSDVKANSIDAISTIIGTISLGLSVEGSGTHAHSESPTTIPRIGVTPLKSALDAQVVSMTDLERALAGEPIRIGLVSLASTHRSTRGKMIATQEIPMDKIVDTKEISQSLSLSSRSPIHTPNPQHFNEIQTEIIDNGEATSSYQQVPHGLDCGVGNGMDSNEQSSPAIKLQGDTPTPSSSILAPNFFVFGEIIGSNAPLSRDLTKIELANTKRELERTQKESRSYRQQLEQSKKDLELAMMGIKNYARSIQELQRANAQEKEIYLHNAQHELDDARALANNLRRELQGAQAFLVKADSLTAPELSCHVTRLNEDIFQAAASLGEHVCRKQWSLPEEEATRRTEDTSKIIGSQLVQITLDQARNSDAAVHPFLVQVILQVFLNAFCVEKIMMWTPDNRIKNDFLNSLYQGIWEKGKGRHHLSIRYTDKRNI